MTAASGILHKEFHSQEFTRTGGTLEMVQLWVNLPARDKMTAPGYQAILDADIPLMTLPGVQVRVIAGDFQGTRGPARSFTSINLWDVKMDKDALLRLDLPEGHNGYDVKFVPFDGAGKAGAPTDFIEGFAGPAPADRNASKAAYRPVSAAVAKDGALYVMDGNKGRIWRITYSAP